jgi:BolA family transcriptional regulator, general stress-responsive regulator
MSAPLHPPPASPSKGNINQPLSAAEVTALILAACPGANVQVRDDTHLHLGHNHTVGHHGGHYRAHVIWAGFTGWSRLQRHRHLQQAFAAFWANQRIHALTLQLLTPFEPNPRRS